MVHCDTAVTQQLVVQGREMRKYSMPAAQARRSAGITADYLEAVEAESDYEDDGLTASDRARRSLLSRDRLDEQAEVSTYAACLITGMRAILHHFVASNSHRMQYNCSTHGKACGYMIGIALSSIKRVLSDDLIHSDSSLCCFLTCLFSMTASVTFNDSLADSSLAQLAKTVPM